MPGRARSVRERYISSPATSERCRHEHHAQRCHPQRHDRQDAIERPLTAAAVARTMIDMAPAHPITRHLSVVYWKARYTGRRALYTRSHVDKIVAWGGLASITHISKYIQPGIDLITLDPKTKLHDHR